MATDAQNQAITALAAIGRSSKVIAEQVGVELGDVISVLAGSVFTPPGIQGSAPRLELVTLPFDYTLEPLVAHTIAVLAPGDAIMGYVLSVTEEWVGAEIALLSAGTVVEPTLLLDSTNALGGLDPQVDASELSRPYGVHVPFTSVSLFSYNGTAETVPITLMMFAHGVPSPDLVADNAPPVLPLVVAPGVDDQFIFNSNVITVAPGTYNTAADVGAAMAAAINDWAGGTSFSGDALGGRARIITTVAPSVALGDNGFLPRSGFDDGQAWEDVPDIDPQMTAGKATWRSVVARGMFAR